MALRSEYCVQAFLVQRQQSRTSHLSTRTERPKPKLLHTQTLPTSLPKGERPKTAKIQALRLERQRLQRQDTARLPRLRSTMSVCITPVGCICPARWQARTWTQLPEETGGQIAQLDKDLPDCVIISARAHVLLPLPVIFSSWPSCTCNLEILSLIGRYFLHAPTRFPS